MKAKNKLLLLVMYIAVFIGFTSVDTLAATITSENAGGNWNSPSTWIGGVVPGSSDDVTIVSGATVVVNLDLTEANGNRSVGSLTVAGTLRPDAGVRNIEIDNDLSVTGQVNYNYLTTGKLNWVFTGKTDGSAVITGVTNESHVQFNNLSFAGTGVSASGATAGFTVYGDLTVSSLSQFTTTLTTIFNNSSAKTITNNNIINWSTVQLADNSVVNYNGASGSTNTVGSNITIGNSATLAVAAPIEITLTGGSTTISNSGNFNFASGSALNVNHATMITTGSINNFNGELNVNSNLTLSSLSINGTGNLTTGVLATISLANAAGVKGALQLSGTRTFNAATSYTFSGAGDTGFNYATGNDVISVGTITIQGNTTSADDFAVRTNLTVDASKTFIASSGTVSFNANAGIGGAGTKTFKNLAFTGTTGTSTFADGGITVTGDFTSATGGTLNFGGVTVTMTGTGNLALQSTLTGPIIVVDNASANVTLGANINLGIAGTLTLTSGKLDLAGNTITGTASPKVTLTAGTVRTSHADGFFGNFSGYAAGELSVAAGVSYEVYGGAISLGFNFGANNVAGTGGSGSGVSVIKSLKVMGGAPVTTTGSTPQDFAMSGDLTLESGATLTTDNTITFNTTGSVITNNAAIGDLKLKGVTINDGVAVTSATSFTLIGTMSLGNGVVGSAFTMTAGKLLVNTGGVIDFATSSTGAVTLNDVEVAAASSTWANTAQGTIGIKGNLDVTGTAAFSVNAAQGVTFSGTGKTIAVVSGASLTLGDVAISGTYTSPTGTGFTVAGDLFNVTGSYTNTDGLVSFTDASLIITSTDIDKLVFYDVSFNGTVADQVAKFTVKHNFANTAATFDLNNSPVFGKVKFLGNPSTIEATTTASNTEFGDIEIPAGAKVVITSTKLITLSGTLTLAGTLEVNTAGQIAGGGLISSAAGSELIYNGTGTDGFAGAITANGIHSWNANMNLTVGALATALTDLGLDVPTTPITQCGNLTLSESGTVTDMSGDLQVNGNVTVASGVDFALTTTGGSITLAGTNKIFTNESATFQLFNVNVTGSYSETATSKGFSTAGVNASLNISGSWSSANAPLSTITLNGTAAAIPVLAGTGSKTFNNLTFGATVTAATDIAVNYTVMGDLATTSGGVVEHTATSTATLAGANKTLTQSATGRSGLVFGNLNVTGSYAVPTIVDGFQIVSGGAVTVSGSLAVQSGTGTAPSTTEGLEFLSGGTIGGAGTITLGALINTAGVTQILDGTKVTIDGNVTGAVTVTAGTLEGLGNSTVVLGMTSGTNNIINDATLNFANLEIAPNAVVTNNVSFTVTKNLTVGASGSFVSSAGTITIDTAATHTITNAGTLAFNGLTIAATAGNNVVTANDFSIGTGGFTLGNLATFKASAGTVNFATGTLLTNSTADQTNNTNLTFYSLAAYGDLTYNSGPNAPGFTVKGDITSNAILDLQNINNTGRLMLAGSDIQNLIIGASGTDKINLGFTTINNAAGVKLAGATTEGDLVAYRTLRLQNGDLDLNGDNILRIEETNGLLSETVGNTVVNGGTTASLGYVFVSRGSTAFANDAMNGVGLTLTTDVTTTMKVKRYQIPRNIGSVDGISRVFSLESGTLTGLNATAKFRYDDSELNGLTAENLRLTRTDNQMTGPWFLENSTVNTTNKIITVTGIDNFTTATANQYWTATAPVIVSTATLTKGLGNSPLVAGRTNQGIFGLEFSANGDATINKITFGLSRDITIGNEFAKYYLVKSGDNDLATTDDNTVLISGTNGSPASLTVSATGVTFDVAALSQQLSSGVKANYFLVADIATSVTTATAAVNGTFDETNVVLTSSIAEAVNLIGTSYTFKPGLMVDQISNGLKESPLVAGTSSNGLIGFQMTSTSATTGGFDSIFVATNVDVSNIFSNIRLVRSTTNDVTTGVLTNVKVGTVRSNGISFISLAEATSTTAKFYFVVADVKSSVDRNTPSVVFTIADANISDMTTAGPRFINAMGNVSTSFSSPSYTFDNSAATVSLTTPLVAQGTSLGRGVNAQPVYRFTFASDNGNAVTFSKVVAQASLTKGLLAANITSWKLWYDLNGNDYPDVGEQISVGAYNAAAQQGNLTFNLSTPQTTSKSRKYIITVDLAVGTAVNSELKVSLLSQSYVTVSSPTTLNSFANLGGDIYTIKAPGAASTAKIVGLSSNSIISGSSISFTVRAFDGAGVPANIGASASVSLNVQSGGFTFGGTTTGTMAAGGNVVSITPTLSHTTGTTVATVTATLTGGLAVSPTDPTQNITIYKSAPTSNGTVTLSTVTPTTMVINGWTNGVGGTGRILVLSANKIPVPPTNGQTYSPNTDIGANGAQTGPGSFVIAAGASAVTTVTGLTPGVTYYVQVFEYDGTGNLTIYNTSSKTSVAVDNAGTITGNPAFKATVAGSVGGATFDDAVNISTDVNVNSSITNATEAKEGKWFKFRVNEDRNNFYIRLNQLPKNYSLYLYKGNGTELFRISEAVSLADDAVIVNNADASQTYFIKVFGADNTQFDAAKFGLTVVTSADEVLSLIK